MTKEKHEKPEWRTPKGTRDKRGGRETVNDLEAKYADQIAYAPGFAPPASQTTGETTATEQG